MSFELELDGIVTATVDILSRGTPATMDEPDEGPEWHVSMLANMAGEETVNPCLCAWIAKVYEALLHSAACDYVATVEPVTEVDNWAVGVSHA